MKKCFAIALLVLMLCAPALAVQAATTTYTLEALGLQLDIPQEMVVITPDFVSDEEFLAGLGLNLGEVQQSLVQSNVYLNALMDDFGTEIVVVLVEDPGTERLWNVADLDEADIYSSIDGLEAEYVNQGVEGRFESLYKGGQDVTYMVMDLRRPDSGQTAYGRQYYTVINGKGISVTMWSYGLPLEDDQIDLHKAVVDSIVYDEVLENPKPARNAAALGDILRGAAMGAVGGGIFAVALVLVNRQVQRSSNLRPCLVDAATFPGVTFEFKGKIYDRQRYVAERMQRLRFMKSPQRLGQMLEKAQKRAASGKADAVLGQLEVEAITRVMAGE